MGLARTFQIPSLFGKLTVLENAMVAAKGNPGENFLKSMWKRSWIKKEREVAESAFKTLSIVGLYPMWDKPAESLSGGQMKLLEIGRALMGGANVVLLDEPISGVGPRLAREVLEAGGNLGRGLGVTVVIIGRRRE